MTDEQSFSTPRENADDVEPRDGHPAMGDDLPPVEPPSAGLIVQLFLVPAIIVAVVVGMYTLFGQLVSQELDWRQLVTDVRSENPHVRWRGALGLAQMLDADARRSDTGESQKLSSNSEIASALSDLYSQLIDKTNPNEEEIKQIEFLSKSLGRMTVSDVIVPVFRGGIPPERNHEVRKHSLIGLSMLVGQVREEGDELQVPGLDDQVIQISEEGEPLFRHQAAYLLGLLSSQKAEQRLKVLLEDPDQMTRVNAAIGFARNGSPQGIGVFQELLDEAVSWQLDPSSVKTQEDESSYFERMLMLTNTLAAIEQLQPQLDGLVLDRLAEQLDALAGSTRDSVLRTEARQLMLELRRG